MSDLNSDTRPYRQAAGIVLVNPQGLILLGQGSWWPHFWRMPQGGIKQGEKPEETIVRELKEETGIESFSITNKAKHPYTYHYRPVPVVAVEQAYPYKGQSLTWFFAWTAETKTNPTKYVPEGDEPEFLHFEWMRASQAVKLTHDKRYGNVTTQQRQEMYRNVFAEFGLLPRSSGASIWSKIKRLALDV